MGRKRGEAFDHIIIELSGVAEPAAVRGTEKLTTFSIGIINIPTLLSLLNCRFVAIFSKHSSLAAP